MRTFFMKTFELYKGDFADIDPEALFVGTILHSIDHIPSKNMAKLLLTAEKVVEPKFAADVEWGLLLCNLTDSPLCRFYESRFSHASHPFFRKVYKKCKSLNPEYAGYLE